MRPKRLELQGFTSFRENTEISFQDANLFTLSGPTGSGKSSLIDALTFALYGSVPRYDNRNLVAPAISQGLEEMRVLLDFEVEGKCYTAVRVVRRTRNGATTAEARLEQEGRVLAGTAEELTSQVTRLLGLSFEHFIKCAVLPQGEFARFLHESAGKRQDLLVELLELEVYQAMSQRAQARHSRFSDEIRASEKILSEVYEDLSEQTRKDYLKRIRELETCQNSFRAIQQPIAQLDVELQKSRNSLEQIEEEKQALHEVEFPKELAHLSESLTLQKTTLEKVSNEVLILQKKVDESESEIAHLPEQASLEQAIRLDQQVAQAQKEIERLSQQRLQQEVEQQKSSAQLAELSERVSRLQEQLQRALEDHRAAGLAQTLKAGQACPVCEQVVLQIPQKPAPPELEEIQVEIENVENKREQRARQHEQIGARVSRIQIQLENQQKQKADWAEQLNQLPNAKEAVDLLSRRRKLEQDANRHRGRLTALRQEQETLRRRLDELSRVEGKAWQHYQRLRGRLERFQLPAEDSPEDILASWKTLWEWCKGRTQSLEAKEKGLASEIQEYRAKRTEFEEKIRETCQTAGLDTSVQDPVTACSLALAEAQTQLAQIEIDLEKAKDLRKQVKERQEQADAAKELATLLNARNFERWYLNRALQRLVQGASQILRQLTRDQYSLAVDERSNFEVLDHTNAHERRLAKTLSGGETFLASLSLALALSEHVTELSVRGAAPLEALFLDEGFGTLDEDTLEVVADALEELGAGGRMVGIITHVQELARRMPVRFEVSKLDGTSRVERIEN